MPRVTLINNARQVSKAQVTWLLGDLTWTSRYHPVRMKCRKTDLSGAGWIPDPAFEEGVSLVEAKVGKLRLFFLSLNSAKLNPD